MGRSLAPLQALDLSAICHFWFRAPHPNNMIGAAGHMMVAVGQLCFAVHAICMKLWCFDCDIRYSEAMRFS
jgi:hypothetical protein